ncbi:choice-of-anchor B family protein [Aureispira anguillae]|uniref:Choice-of-anchor B family protein n=1 Tax=Aureispira anguillae TaxID=2864201 RepID=A0A915YDD7_9BACT|nr:choice-of-anchor B family protein [Aureispira anguillae]BDS11030.1 choice-of-anchor B family protein [Aureispira anguillae]
MRYCQTKIAIIPLFILFFSAWAQAQPQNFNLTSIGNLPYAQELNDIWGYVDDTGIEYALVGTRTGTSIVSLATPSNPTEVLFIPGATSIWRDLKTWGDYAYVTSDQGKDGLLIIDLSPLPNGTPTYQFWKPELTINNATDTLWKAHNLYIDEAGFCYIAGSNISAGETFILDVNTTAGSPVLLGATLPIYAHDAYTRGDTLWTSDINDGTFSVYNVSDKTNPIIMGNQTTPRDFAHNAWISDDGQTLFTTDEKSNAWVAAFDVSDLGNIQELDRYRTPNPNTIPHNTHTFNDYLVTSYYTDGLIIIDASRPDNLIEVGRYDTYHLTPETGFYGAWGAYPFLPSGLILVSDINTGLHILQANYQRACWLEGIVTDQSTSATLFDVDVQILNTYAEDQTDLFGIYKTGIGVSGTYDVEFKKAGYIPQTIQVTLNNNQVTTQNVQLVPATAFTLSGQVVDSINPSWSIGNAVLHFQSSLYEYTTTADANGNFSLVIFPDNDYKIIAGHWGNHAKIFDLVALDSTVIPNQVYPLARGYKDEFALDYGWSEFGNATAGKWERGIPSPLYTWQGSVLPEDGDLTHDIGSYCLITGNNGNGIHGTDDVDSGATTIMSPPMNLSNAVDPILTYHYFFSANWPPSGLDSFEVYMTNGTDTVTVMSTQIPNYTWSGKEEVRILDHLALSNNMRVYFKVNDDSGTALEALIDLFEIVDSLSTAVTVIPDQTIDLHYFPNPFSHTINIDYEMQDHASEKLDLHVYNALGQLIEQKVVEQRTGTLELGHSWNAGVYFVNIGRQSIKIVKSQ